MGIFKRVKMLEDQNVSMAKYMSAVGDNIPDIWKKTAELSCNLQELESNLQQLKEKLNEIEGKLPDYERAVERGVNDVWEKAVSDVMNFYPGMMFEEGKS